MQKKWEWEESIWSFMDMVRWALVYRRLGAEDPKKLYDIMSDPDAVDKAADEYGMDYQTVAEQMAKISKGVITMLEIAKKSRLAEEASENHTETPESM